MHAAAASDSRGATAGSTVIPARVSVLVETGRIPVEQTCRILEAEGTGRIPAAEIGMILAEEADSIDFPEQE